jgi:Serine acetyltransferase
MELNCKNFPNKEGILELVDTLKRYMYPGIYGECNKTTLVDDKIVDLYTRYIFDDKTKALEFLDKFKSLKDILDDDAKAIFDGDPAADSIEEIISVYPGFKATFYHRIAHILYVQNFQTAARLISEESHYLTGIDIHPGATIGRHFMIDHGTGIVIGETTTIGDFCKIYQGVTLGALSLSGGHKLHGVKRHPTIGNHVTIYSGASILGGEAIIGNHVIIGSNVFLTKSIPDYVKVTIQEPNLVFIKREKK